MDDDDDDDEDEDDEEEEEEEEEDDDEDDEVAFRRTRYRVYCTNDTGKEDSMGKDKDKISISQRDYDTWTKNARDKVNECEALRQQNNELRQLNTQQEKELAFLREVKARETLTDDELKVLLTLARPVDVEVDECAMRDQRRHLRTGYGHPAFEMLGGIVAYRPVRTPLLEKAERALEVELTRRGIFPVPPGSKAPPPVEPVKELTLEIVEREAKPEPPPEPKKDVTVLVREY